MKKLTVDKLKELAESAKAEVASIRDGLERHRAKLAELDTPKSKQTYQPQHLAQRKSETRIAALNSAKARKSQLDAKAAPALKQRDLWSKQQLLREARFVPERVVEQFASEAGITNRLLTELFNEMRTNRAVQRASRMTNAQLSEALNEAAKANDRALFNALSEETDFRLGRTELEPEDVNVMPVEERRTVLKGRRDRALDEMPFNELAEAEAAFKDLDDALGEADAITENINNPFDTWSKGLLDFYRLNRENPHWRRQRPVQVKKEEPEAEAPSGEAKAEAQPEQATNEQPKEEGMPAKTTTAA